MDAALDRVVLVMRTVGAPGVGLATALERCSRRCPASSCCRRMPLVRFCVFTTAGSLVWNAALILAGYELGAQWHVVEAYVGGVGNIVWVLLATVLAVVVARRLRQRRAAA